MSGQPHLFKVSQAGMQVLVEGVLCLPYELQEIQLFQIKHKQLCQDRVKEVSEIHKRGVRDKLSVIHPSSLNLSLCH